MASLRIRTIAVIIVAALALSGAVFIGNSVLIRTNISNADTLWRNFQDDSSPKARALEFLVTNMGFGGLIHQFKDYVLRRDNQRVGKIINMADGALAALKQYEAAGVNEVEIRAIKSIRRVIILYTGSIKKIQLMAERGLGARYIDGKIRINDKPALTGIGVLMRTVADDRQVLQGQISKTELLSRINAAMGYGGMIHQFKNYLLRQDRSRIKKIHKAVTTALKDIAMYRSLGTSPSEAEALKAIEDVVLVYNSSVDRATELAGLGETPEAIDRQIKINNKPALNGMSRLNTEVAAQNQKVRRNLDRSFAEIQLLAAVIMAVAIISTIALIVLSIWALNFRIVRPIREITDTMDDLANGKTELELRQQEDDNEIGQMAKAVIVFRDNAIEMKRMEEERVKTERRVDGEKHTLMNKMADDFQASIGGVVETVSSAATELQSSAQSMSEISERTSTQANAVTAASEEASANVQTVAAATEELSSSIAEISRQVTQSTEISGSAVKAAGKANEMVQHLAMSAHKIGEVVEMIADIADQTNLLALNATIEAARAGEAGKGFAVVASEVKNLASQTARATDEIGSQINDIQGATKNSVQAIQEITNTIGEINEIASAIAAAVEQQGAATQEIARNVEQAASGTDEMSSNIKGVTQTAGDAGSSAAHVLGAANELSEQSEILKTEVDKFIGHVRAA